MIDSTTGSLRRVPITARGSLLLASALAAFALTPAVASAGSIAYQGDTLVITAAPGEVNGITFGGEEAGRLSISDATGYSFPADRCSQLDPEYAIQCDSPAAVRADLGDGNDFVVVDHMVAGNPVVEVLGGAGNDNLKAIDGNTRLTLDGGPGADVLRSEGGNDVLRGGPDGDELIGGAGGDVLEGGDGADNLSGDACEAPGADVLDGGAGFDTLTDWGDCGPNSDRRPVTVTVNGTADDGRPGEGDDVRDLDALELYVPATVIGTDGDESVAIYAPADREPSSIQGRGGADDLRAGSGRETIDGGAGDDRIEGGFNHDTLTGGPGRDAIYGDSTSGNCGGYGQSCTIPFGNDTIDARDGEADQVDCGPGEDTAKADAVDTVAANCEHVDRGAGGNVGTPGAMTLDVKAPRRLRALLRKGLVVRLAGFRPGTTPISVRAARKLLATARAKVREDGRATVRIRFDRKARRALSRRRSVTLVVAAGSMKRKVKVTSRAPATATASGVEKATFKVSVEGVQTTTWRTDHPGSGGCDVAVSGHGSETVRFASKPIKVQATVLEGLSTPALSSPATYAQPELKLRGKVTRAGTLDAAPGPCGGTGGGSIARDCGAKSFRGVSLPVAYRLAAKPRDQLDLTPAVISDPFVNCPSAGTAFPVLVHTKEGEHMRTELPRNELFDDSLGKIVVIARGSESETAGEHTYRTQIRWEVTFVRVKRGR